MTGKRLREPLTPIFGPGGGVNKAPDAGPPDTESPNWCGRDLGSSSSRRTRAEQPESDDPGPEGRSMSSDANALDTVGSDDQSQSSSSSLFTQPAAHKVSASGSRSLWLRLREGDWK